MPDGRTALLDFGIVGRLSEPRRLAFLRLMMTATSNDLKGQIEALRDLGALPAGTDVQAVVKELGLDRPAIDPTKMEPEELVKEIQNTVKALLGIGARMPKELMLFVKNLVFLDGAIATLAPNLDLLAEIGEVSMHFATAHGERLANELGFDVSGWQLDLDGVKAGLGLESDEGTTYREFQERRDLIRNRLQKRDRSPGHR
jgi:ubiquinone biosynthesis protein